MALGDTFGFLGGVQVIAGRPTKISFLPFPLQRFSTVWIPATTTMREIKLSLFIYTPLSLQNAPMHMWYRVPARLESFAISVQLLEDHFHTRHRRETTRHSRQKHQQVPKIQIPVIEKLQREEFRNPRFVGSVSLMAVHWIKRLSV